MTNLENFLDNIRNDHKDFDHGKLEEVFGDNPYAIFNQWMKNAIENEELEPNAFSICSINEQNEPSSRIVYMKEILKDEFIFYTNYLSEKGQNIALNPTVSMLFFWPKLQRQVRISGICSKVDGAISDDYFHSRPRESQLGAWASHQSEKLESRSVLEERFKEISERFPTKIDRPENWGGYGINPTKFEFWQGRPSRLHDRILFEKDGKDWVISRLNP